MSIFLQIIASIIISDVLIAFFHWIEDTYFDYCMNIPILRGIAKRNEMHHYFPRDIMYTSFLKSIMVPTTISLLIVLSVAVVCSPRFVIKYAYFFATLVLIGTFSGYMHALCHARNCERPPWYALLSEMGILVGHDHHKQHHDIPTCKYGVLFPMTNYLLDGIGFWRFLEKIVLVVTGIRPNSKIPYNELAHAIGYTRMHELTKRSDCPRVVDENELKELTRMLEAHYACSYQRR